MVMLQSWPFEKYLVERKERRDKFVKNLIQELIESWEKKRDDMELLVKRIAEDVTNEEHWDDLRKLCEAQDLKMQRQDLRVTTEIIRRYDEVHLPDLNAVLKSRDQERNEVETRITKIEAKGKRKLEDMEREQKNGRERLMRMRRRIDKSIQEIKDIEDKIELLRTTPKEKLPRKSSVDQEAVAALRNALEEEKDKQMCLICFERPKDTVLVPCLHLQYCQVCVATILRQGGSCPVCRHPVSKTFKCMV